jgi:hypothetical protein
VQIEGGALLGDELVLAPSPSHLVLSILFHTQARGHAVICQSKRCVSSVPHECAWWRFNSFLIEMAVEIPRKAAWSYLIGPAHDESTTSIPKSRCKDEEENRQPQTSPQGAVSATRVVLI